MSALRTPGDPAFSFGPNGKPRVRFPAGEEREIDLEELTALTVARTQTPLGAAAAELVGRLAGKDDAAHWARVVAGLEQKGLLQRTDAAATGAVFALEAGETEGAELRLLLQSNPRLAPLEPNGFALAMTEWIDALTADAQSLGVGHDWVRETTRRCSDGLLAKAAAARPGARWIQFLPPHALGHVDRLDRLHDEAARYIVYVRHALDFVDVAHRTFCLVDPMVLYASGWPNRIAGRPGDFHTAVASHWAEFAKAAAAFKARNPSRVYLLRREDVVRDCPGALAGLCGFLGESAAASGARLEGPSGDWKRWPSELKGRLAPIVNEGLVALGYPRLE